jgi:hypothetical protein
MSDLPLAMPPGAKLHAVATTKISTAISQTPRVNRNRANSRRLFLPAIRPALVPASSTNTGAQKCVIQRTVNSPAETLGSAIGSTLVPARK